MTYIRTAEQEKARKSNLSATPTDGVECKLDGVWVHSIPAYLKSDHAPMTVQEYQALHPTAPLLSQKLVDAQARKKAADEAPIRKSFSEVFGLGDVPASKNKRGEAIMIEVLGEPDPAWAAYVPEVDRNYIFPIDNLKAVLMATVMNERLLLWGKHGTGKTTLIEQFCANTNRPCIRIQHTVDTEASHVTGQYVVREVNGHAITVFQPGPLAIAMRYGLYYIADEYDFALPSVVSVYQPVMEGKQLLIKDATPEWMVVKPHKNFRFAATGNTNGGGDETGLYQGTQMQNAANYSRFGITMQVDYMPKKQEIGVIVSQGQIHEDDATHLVNFAILVREAYSRGDIGSTISPRELITAAKLARGLGGEWKQALAMSYTNRLNVSDKSVVLGLVQREFG